MHVERTIEPYLAGPAWLIGAKTNLVDRFRPDVERIRLPEVQVAGGTLTARHDGKPNTSFAEVTGGRAGQMAGRLYQKASARVGHVERVPPSSVAIDFRYNSPDNWSHALNIHLTLGLFLRKCLHESLGQTKVTAVLPRNIPGYIRELYSTFEFDCLCTDLPVEGNLCQFDSTPPISLRSVMIDLNRECLAGTALAGSVFAHNDALPEKVFVSRKHTRALENEAEIERLLTARGFAKVYPESLSVEDQFRLYAQASEIVVVHGAGVAPLAYRPESAPPVRIVELLSPAHMTNFVRVMADQLDSPWIGVRGRLWPGLLEGAYDFSRPFTRFSLENFQIDPESLELGLDVVSGRVNL